MSDYAVTAIGRDRPGIVAALSRALLELRGNIEDSQMSILRGHFAAMLIVRLPDEEGDEQLRERLYSVRDELGLEGLTVEEVTELPATSAARASHVLSVYGADRPGIVASMSAVLAAQGANIIDLETRLAGSEEAPLYMMLMQVSLGEAPIERVRAAVGEAAAEAGVEVSLRALDAEAL